MGDVVVPVDERTEAGSSYLLRRHGADWDIVVDGRLAMSTRGARVEDAVVELALTPWGPRDDLGILLAGLGMGLTLRALLARPQVKRVEVVEVSTTIVDWARGPLAALNGGAASEGRVSLVARDLLAHLR